MKRGDKIRLKDGAEAIITNIGLGDFLGDPKPVYYTVVRSGDDNAIGDAGFVMSNELRAQHENMRSMNRKEG